MTVSKRRFGGALPTTSPGQRTLPIPCDDGPESRSALL
jgi:hypothetical protein